MSFLKNLFTWNGNNPFGYKHLQVNAMSENQSVDFLINDWSTPQLIKKVPLPEQDKDLTFSVMKMKPQYKRINTPDWRAANAYYAVGNTINWSHDIIKKCRPPLKWANRSKLIVNTDAGKNLNAFYNRKALVFFYDKHPKTGKVLYTADSADIVIHELGHAILDAIRPDFWSVQALEIWSLHESFADITSLASMAQHKEALEFAYKQVNGNFRKSNIISRMAEQLGSFVYDVSGGTSGNQGYLRDAVNNFKYVNPKKLPQHGPDNKLLAECHSFGRLFVAAWYDIVCGIYERELPKKNWASAFQDAINVAYKYLIQACILAPRVGNMYDAISRLMLEADKIAGSPYKDILNGVFKDRNLIRPRVSMLVSSKVELNSIIGQLSIDDVVIPSGDKIVVRKQNRETMRLSEMKDEITALSGTLANADAEIANDVYYVFNKDGKLEDGIYNNRNDLVEDVYLCLKFIEHDQNQINPSWEVNESNLLERIHIK